MKVNELITGLQLCDPDAIVVISSDSEGNSYDELTHAGIAMDNMAFDPEAKEVGIQFLNPVLKKKGFTTEDILANGKPAVVFYP